MAVSASLPNGLTPPGAKSHPNGATPSVEKPAQPPTRNIHSVVLGSLIIDPWFSSEGYPEELVGKDVPRLHVCQWCFKYTQDFVLFAQHVVRSSYPLLSTRAMRLD